eukprot:2368072-Rhodomonas_salina.14
MSISFGGPGAAGPALSSSAVAPSSVALPLASPLPSQSQLTGKDGAAGKDKYGWKEVGRDAGWEKGAHSV